MLDLIVLFFLGKGPVETCWSTQFGHPGDGYGGRTPTLYYKRPVAPGDMGIAHRKWPIGRKVLVENIRTNKWAIGRIIDRGPYGKTAPDGSWFNGARERKRPGTWRGCADLTPDLAKEINHDGKDRIRITLLAKESDDPRELPRPKARN